MKIFSVFMVVTWMLWCGIATVSWIAAGNTWLAVGCGALTALWGIFGYFICTKY